MQDGPQVLSEMNERSREVFRQVVEGYLENGEPVGSRTLARSILSSLAYWEVRT